MSALVITCILFYLAFNSWAYANGRSKPPNPAVDELDDTVLLVLLIAPGYWLGKAVRARASRDGVSK